MKKRLTIGMLTAAILVVAPAAFADDDGEVAPTPYYERGARIIQVPQRGEIERVERRASLRDDREIIAPPPPRRQAAPKPQRRADAPPPRKPFNVSPPPPPPAGPRRAVLSAPPPRIGEKLATPPETAVTAEAPPAGYMPLPPHADDQPTDAQ